MSITSTKTQELKFPVLAEHADAIRRLGRQTAENIIEIGRRLTLCKKEISHGDWSGWLKQEFDWSDQQARRFMHVFELAESKSNKLLNLNLPVSSLYLLAAPSTPEVARSEIIERAKNGAPVSVDEVKGTIAAAKGDVSKPVAKPTMAATTTAAKGRKQQARKGWSRERWRRHKERKRGHRSKNATPAAAPPTPAQARQDIGPASTGEVEAAVAAAGMTTGMLEAVFELLNLFVTDPAAWQQRMAKAGTEGKRKIANSYRELAKQCMAAAQALDDEIESAQGNGSDPEASAGKRKAAYALEAASDPSPMPECLR